LPPPAPEGKRVHSETLRRTGMKRRRALVDLVRFTNGFPERIDGYPERLASASDDLPRPPSGRRPFLAQEGGNPLSAQRVCTGRTVIWLPGTPRAVWTSDSVFARSVPRLRPVSPMSPLT
jgi:hypothetical protein